MIASSTSVILQEDIDKMQSTQPHEILRYVPGLNFLAQGNSEINNNLLFADSTQNILEF